MTSIYFLLVLIQLYSTKKLSQILYRKPIDENLLKNVSLPTDSTDSVTDKPIVILPKCVIAVIRFIV